MDEMTIAAIASGNSPSLTNAARAHLAECARCRVQLSGAMEMLGAPEIGQEIDRLERRDSPRKRRLPGWTRMAALAAALAGLVFAPQLFRMPDNDAARRARDLRDADPTITKTVPPKTVAPVGTVDAAGIFVWTRVPDATRYGVRLYAIDGTVVWGAQTNDTTIALPASVELTPGRVYLYQVDAHTSFDRSAQSELTEFQIRVRAR